MRDLKLEAKIIAYVTMTDNGLDTDRLYKFLLKDLQEADDEVIKTLNEIANDYTGKTDNLSLWNYISKTDLRVTLSAALSC